MPFGSLEHFIKGIEDMKKIQETKSNNSKRSNNNETAFLWDYIIDWRPAEMSSISTQKMWTGLVEPPHISHLKKSLFSFIQPVLFF